MDTIEDAQKALLKLFYAFPTSGSETEKKLKFEAYWEILSTQNPSSSIKACDYAAKGKMDDSAEFMPSAAQLYRLAADFTEREMRMAPKNPHPFLIERRES